MKTCNSIKAATIATYILIAMLVQQLIQIQSAKDPFTIIYCFTTLYTHFYTYILSKSQLLNNSIQFSLQRRAQHSHTPLIIVMVSRWAHVLSLEVKGEQEI